MPFDEWLNSLPNPKAQTAIDKRLERITASNLGNYRSVGGGICELKIDYGPGYRIYFGQIGSTIILILCGGDKSSQAEDIAQAIKYWNSYRS